MHRQLSSTSVYIYPRVHARRYGSFEDGDAKLDEMEMVDGFEIAIKKLTEWLAENIDKNKTRIFFAGSSPTHSW